MARKTKAEKIATNLRQQEKVQYSLNLAQSQSTTPKAVEIRSSDYDYVVSDLKRIGIFTVLAFGAEFILWYFLRVR